MLTINELVCINNAVEWCSRLSSHTVYVNLQQHFNMSRLNQSSVCASVPAAAAAAYFISELAPALATSPVHISHSEWVLYCASSHLYWLSSATSSFDELYYSGNLKYSLTAVFNAGERSHKKPTERQSLTLVCIFLTLHISPQARNPYKKITWIKINIFILTLEGKEQRECAWRWAHCTASNY